MDLHLLRKFYQGKCSSEERAIVMRWLEEEGEDENFMQQLADYWDTYQETPDDHNAPSILINIQDKIQADEQDQPLLTESGSVSSKRRVLSTWLKVAAVLILGIGISWGSYQLTREETPSAPIISTIEKEVARGQKLKVTLDDGTQVFLNSESTLTYPQKFSANKREVTLIGEAFFEVARDTSRPFTINAQDIQVSVLGTSFNINAYEGDSTISVAVASGKVKVNQTSQHTYFLEPGKELTYQPNLDHFEVNEFDRMERLAWKDGILYFKDASIQEVKKTLERWYGVEMSIQGDDQLNWQYSGVFERQSLENVLEGMSYVQRFDYEINNKQVTITL